MSIIAVVGSGLRHEYKIVMRKELAPISWTRMDQKEIQDVGKHSSWKLLNLGVRFLRHALLAVTMRHCNRGSFNVLLGW